MYYMSLSTTGDLGEGKAKTLIIVILEWPIQLAVSSFTILLSHNPPLTLVPSILDI